MVASEEVMRGKGTAARRAAVGMLATLVLLAGPWVGNGAAPCDWNGGNCFQVPAPADAALTCASKITTQRVDVVVQCVAGLVRADVGSLGDVKVDPSSLHLKPGADARIEITVKRLRSDPNLTGKLNFAFAFDGNATQIDWKTEAMEKGNVFLQGTFKPNETASRSLSIGLRVKDHPTSAIAILPFVFHDDYEGSRHWLGFNIIKTPAPAPGIVAAVAAALFALALMRGRRSPGAR